MKFIKEGDYIINIPYTLGKNGRESYSFITHVKGLSYGVKITPQWGIVTLLHLKDIIIEWYSTKDNGKENIHYKPISYSYMHELIKNKTFIHYRPNGIDKALAIINKYKI